MNYGDALAFKELQEENQRVKNQIITMGSEKTYLIQAADNLKAENEELKAKLLASKN